MTFFKSPAVRFLFILGLWGGAVAANGLLLPKQHALKVEVETVSLAPIPMIVWASGTLEARKSQSLKAEFDGPVVLKAFREGQRVRKGDLLFQIGRDRIQLSYQSKRNALRNAEADLTKATKDVRLQKVLFSKQAVAYSSVEDAEADLVRKRQALESAKETFRLEEEQWNSAKLFAPFDGSVVKDGIGDEKFARADREIFVVADETGYLFKAQVDELDIKKIREDQKGFVKLQAFPEMPLMAQVEAIGSQTEGQGIPQVSVQSRLVSTGNLPLRPRLSGEIRIFTGVSGPILSVPATAVANTDGQARVWVVNVLKKINSVPVTLGSSNPDRVEITSGLRAGQIICKTAEPTFENGMRVMLQTSPVPAAKAKRPKAKS